MYSVEMQITNGFVVTEERAISLNKISSQTNVRSYTAQLCECVVKPWVWFRIFGFFKDKAVLTNLVCAPTRYVLLWQVKWTGDTIGGTV